MRLGVVYLSIAAVPLIAASGSPAVPDSLIRVTVSEEVTQAGALYRYTVMNPLPADPIRQFMVGVSYEGPYELRQPPKGWTFEGGVPAGSAQSPKGWTFELLTQEEKEEVMVHWLANEARFQLQPGQSATFTVLVDKPDPTYTQSHWAVVDKHSEITGGRFELLSRRRNRKE